MSTLFGTKIKDTYDGLLKVSDNVGITSTKKIITDGLGNDSSVYISDEDFQISTFFYVDINSGTPASSKIGLGTSSPTTTLHIVGDLRLTARFYDGSNSSGTSGRVLMSTGAATSWSNTFTTAMTFDAGVILNAGIKDYTGSTGTSNQILSSTGSDVEWVSLSEISGVDGSGVANKLAYWLDTNTITYDNLLHWDSSNDRLGVGTATPQTKLEVNGSFRVSSGNEKYLDIPDGGYVYKFGDIDGGEGNSYLEIDSNNSETNLYKSTLGIPTYIFHHGNTTTKFGFSTTDTFVVRTNDVERFSVNNSGVALAGGSRVTTILDEDDMASDSNTALATQQSIKAFVESEIASVPSGLNFQGNWNADTNSPTLASSTGTIGHFYNVSTPGSTNLDGETDWKIGDWAVFVEAGGTDKWMKIDNTSVLSGVGSANKIAYWSNDSTLTYDTDFYVDGDTIYTTNLEASGNITSLTANFSDNVYMSGGQLYLGSNNATTDDSYRMYVTSGQFVLASRESGTWTTYFDINTSGNATFAGKIIAEKGVNYTGGTIAQATTVLHTNNVIYSRGGSAGMFLQNADGSEGMFIANDYVKIETNSAERMRVDSTGRLLINTTTPFGNAAITAVGLSSTNVAAVFKSTDNQAWISIQDDDSGTYGALLGTDSDAGLDFLIADKNVNKRLVIDTSGNVGIGTTSPSEKLEVEGNILVTSDSATSLKIQAKNSSSFNDPVLEFVTWDVSSGASSGKIQLTNGAWNNNDMAFYTETSNSVTEKMRIDSAGNVQARRTRSNTAGEVALSLQPTDSTIHYGFRIDQANNYLNIDRVDSAGNLMILDYNGNGTFTGNITTQSDSSVLGGSGSVPLYVRSTGTVSYVQIQTSTTGSNTTSDGLTVGVNGSTAYIWQRENASLHLGTNDSAALTINSSQKVGIGTTSPSSKLHVSSGTSGATVYAGYNDLIIEGNDGASLSFLMPDSNHADINFGTPSSQFCAGIRAGYNSGTEFLAFKIADSEKIRIIDSGNVGIGTTSPSTNLEVYVAGKFKVDVSAGSPIIDIVNNSAVSSTSGTATLKFTQGNTQTGGKIVSGRDGNYSSGATRTSNLQFYTSTNASDTEKMRITSTGNLGIGTTSPLTQLHLSNTNGGAIYIQDSDSTNTYNITSISNGGGNLTFDTRNSTGGFVSTDYQMVKDSSGANYQRWFTQGNERMRIASNGNVGIGTTSPDYLLDVSSGASNDAYIQVRNADDSAGAYFKARSGFDGYYGIEFFDKTTAKWYIGGYGSNRLGFWVGSKTTASNEKMSFTTDGRLGIGTTSPSEKLHVSTSNNTVAKFESTDANANIRIGDTVDNTHIGTDGGKTYIGADTSVGGNNLTILSDGKVGIGTGSPNNKLDVKGDIGIIRSGTTNTSTISMEGNFIFNASSGYNYKFKHNSSDLVIFKQTGEVGIGTTSPGTNLDIVGVGAQSLRVKSDSSATIIIDSDGDNDGTAGSYLHYRDTGATKWTLYKETNNDFYLYNGAAGTYPIHAKANGHIVLMEDGNNLGIGASSPSYKLDVNGDLRTKTHWIDLSATTQRAIASTGTDSIQFGDAGVNDLRFKNASGVALDIKSTGKVGIGTTSPSTKLDVVGEISASDDINTTGKLFVYKTDAELRLKTTNNSTGTSLINFADPDDNDVGQIKYDHNNNEFTFRSTDALALTLDYDSATFAGTITSGNISVTGGGGGNGQIDVLRTSGANVRIQSQTATGVLAVTTNHPLHLKTNDTTRVTIAADGKVGIGTTSPVSSYQLTIEDGQTAGIALSDTGQSGDYQFAANSDLCYWRYDGDNTKGIFLKNSGNIGIGTTSPSKKLEVHSGGASDIARFGNNNGGFVVGYTTNLASIDLSATSQKFRIRQGSSVPFTIDDSQRVGIGTTSPVSHLEIAENTVSSNFTGITVTNSAGASSDDSRAGIAFKCYDWVQSAIWHGRNISGNLNGALVLGTNPDTSDLTVGGVVGRLHILNNGKVQLNAYGSGTYTGTATQRLAVDSSGNIIELAIGSGAVDGSGAANKLAIWSDADTLTSDTNLHWDTTNDRLGIGTTSPNADVNIISKMGSTTSDWKTALNIGTTEEPTYSVASISVKNEGKEMMLGSNLHFAGESSGNTKPDTSKGSSAIYMYTNNSTSTTTGTTVIGGHYAITDGATSSIVSHVTILGDGKVGIGTSTPNRLLTVGGTSQFNDTPYFSTRGLISWGSMGGGTGFGIRAESGNALSLGANGTWDYLIIDTSGNATFSGAVNIAASQKIYLGGSTARMHIYHTGSSGTANILTKEGDLNLVNQSHGDDIVFKTENSSGTVVTPLTLDSAGAATFGGNVQIDGGNLGIGTTPTSRNLSVFRSTAGSVANFLHYTDSSNFSGLYIDVSDDANLVTLNASGSHGATWEFQNGNTTNLTMNSVLATFAGSVHLDNDSAQLQLGDDNDMQVYHNGANGVVDNNTGDLIIRCDSDDIKILAEDDVVIRDNDDSTEMAKFINGGAVELYNNGNKKIETTSSGVDCSGYYGFTSTGNDYGFYYGVEPGSTQGIAIKSSDTGGAYFDGLGYFWNSNTGNGANMFQMQNDGNTYCRYFNFFRGGNSSSDIIGYIGYNSTNTATTFSTSSSDERLKKNIVDWNESVLPKFLSLEPKQFHFNSQDDSEGKNKGYIAQNEVDNFPEVYQLNGEDADARYGFHPMEMTPYLMKAIKELVEKNKELENRLEALEN